MLNRKYLVPEIHEPSDSTKPDETVPLVDACLDRLENLKTEISDRHSESDHPSIELQLESLFSGNCTRVITEMERIAIILCRIAHRIIRSEKLTETDYSILQQIFELGLFLIQFKDRWLNHLEKTKILSGHNWKPLEEHANPQQIFPPARELVSLAQEYIIRQNVLTGNRCDLCAYALANIISTYAPSIALLAQNRRPDARTKNQSEAAQTAELLPLNHFYFLIYTLSNSPEDKTKILVNWVQESVGKLEGEIFYLPPIDEHEYFSQEMKKIRNIDSAMEVLKVSRSHFLLWSASIITGSHRRNKITTKTLTDLTVSTYQKKHKEYTIKFLQEISKYNPVASETITKALIIVGDAKDLSAYFFKTSFIIDRDYVESAIISIDDLSLAPKETLQLLCSGDYFSVLCADKAVFTKVVKTIAETHTKETVQKKEDEIVTRKGWDISSFCRRIFQVQNISISSLEKGLILMMYFPAETFTVKRAVWEASEAKGASSVRKSVDSALSLLPTKISKSLPENISDKKDTIEETDRTDKTKGIPKEIEHILDVLNHYREIPSIQKQLLKIAKQTGLFSILEKYEPDVFTIQCIKKEIKRLRSDMQSLHVFLLQLKAQNGLRSDSFWFIQAKKHIILGSAIRSLNSVMMQDDMLYLLNNEEDIIYLLRLVTQRAVPDVVLAASLIEKLEAEPDEIEGLVCGGNSSITATIPSKLITVYAVLLQKEFAGKQSIVKVLGTEGEIELFLQDGVLFFRSLKIPKDRKDLIEEREKKISYTFSSNSNGKRASSDSEGPSGLSAMPAKGWHISIALTVGHKSSQVTIDDFVVSVPYGVKPSSVVIGEGFQGILSRALILEEMYKPGRLSTRPNDQYYIENLFSIEKTFQYYGKFALLIDSTVPYRIHGKTHVKIMNVFKSTGSQWRTSERLCRYIAKLSSKHYQIEEALHTHILLPDALPEYLRK